MRSKSGVRPEILRSWQSGIFVTVLALSGCSEAVETAQAVKTEAAASEIASLFEAGSIAVCVSLVDGSIVTDLGKGERFRVTPAFADLHLALPAVRLPAEAEAGTIIELFSPNKQHESYFTLDAVDQPIAVGGGVVGCYAASEVDLRKCSSGVCETNGAFEFHKR
jgi:hypothetical protein